jgi:hypothetical protein
MVGEETARHHDMTNRYCEECGYANPGQARFCMNCGAPFALQLVPGTVAGPVRAVLARSNDTDWTGIATAVLTSLGLWHASPKMRQTFILVLFLMLFFGLPMVCGFVAFMLQWIGRLFS